MEFGLEKMWFFLFMVKAVILNYIMYISRVIFLK